MEERTSIWRMHASVSHFVAATVQAVEVHTRRRATPVPGIPQFCAAQRLIGFRAPEDMPAAHLEFWLSPQILSAVLVSKSALVRRHI